MSDKKIQGLDKEGWERVEEALKTTHTQLCSQVDKSSSSDEILELGEHIKDVEEGQKDVEEVIKSFD